VRDLGLGLEVLERGAHAAEDESGLEGYDELVYEAGMLCGWRCDSPRASHINLSAISVNKVDH
jgi:hypothetical protein